MTELGSRGVTISGSQLIHTGDGIVEGFIVNSHSSGTLKLWDNTAGSGTVLMNTFTFASGSSVVKFPDGIIFTTGLFADMTVDESVTIVYRETG